MTRRYTSYSISIGTPAGLSFVNTVVICGTENEKGNFDNSTCAVSDGHSGATAEYIIQQHQPSEQRCLTHEPSTVRTLLGLS